MTHTSPLTTYVINLQRSAERRNFMEVHLSEFPELDCRFISAVDGKILNPAELLISYDEGKAVVKFEKPLLAGEIGCALSHIECYKKMLAERKKFVLILEDDIIMSAYFPLMIPALSEWLSSDAPRVVLLTPCRLHWKWPSMPLSQHHNLHKICKTAWSAAAYLINDAAAAVLAENLFPVYAVADDWQYLRQTFKIDVRVTIPHCASFRRCNDLSSTIGFRHIGRHKKKYIRRLEKLWWRPLSKAGVIRFGRRSW
jgi:glycosyl transferase family 25